MKRIFRSFQFQIFAVKVKLFFYSDTLQIFKHSEKCNRYDRIFTMKKISNFTIKICEFYQLSIFRYSSFFVNRIFQWFGFPRKFNSF
jgi:hypothetical protein